MSSLNSVDIILEINKHKVLLIKRSFDPCKGKFALPGGKQDNFESLENAVFKVIKETLGLNVKLKGTEVEFEGMGKHRLYQIKTYDSGTDPRGGNTTVFAIQLACDETEFIKKIKLGAKASDVKIMRKDKLPLLAFDHNDFIKNYFEKQKPFPETKETYDSSIYKNPSVTVDILIFTIKNDSLKLLLIKRKSWPYENHWAIPGGFVDVEESVYDAAKRELKEETNISEVYLEQLYTFGDVNRDPRTRVISVSYFALVSAEKLTIEAASDAKEAKLYDVDKLPKLAFDHEKIVEYGISRLRNKIEYTNIAFQLLSKKFTLTELQKAYEIILNTELDKRNFRKKIKEQNLLKALNETKRDGAHRPAKLYSFKKNTDKTIMSSKKII